MLSSRFTPCLLGCFLVLGLVAARAAVTPAAMMQQTDVFVAGQDGIHEYRIPGIVTTGRGTLIAFCDARVNKPGDPPNKIDLVLKRSFDFGRTWGPLQRVAENGNGAVADSCGFVDRQTGTIWIFSVYAPEGVGSSNAEPGFTGRVFQYKAITSDDDGATWSKPIDFTPMVKRPEWGAGSTGVGSGIQMCNGRLILPRYYADYRQPRIRDEDGSSFVCYSDDHGKTWKMGALTQFPGGTNECQVVELSDGSLLLNMRGITGNTRKISRSRDGGETWSKVVEDPNLIEPRCQGSIYVLTDPRVQDRSRILFTNPASLERKQMTVRLSYDEGKSWPVSRLLHAGPAAYSCLTVLADKTGGCLYERGDKHAHEKITFARFSLEWLTEGRDSITTRR